MIHAAFKRGFNNEPISDFTQYQYLLKEETKTRNKLESIKKKVKFFCAKIFLQYLLDDKFEFEDRTFVQATTKDNEKDCWCQSNSKNFVYGYDNEIMAELRHKNQ